MKEGFYPLSAEQYHGTTGEVTLSSHILHLMLTRSPLHAWHAHPLLNPNYREEESARLDYGSAAHDVLLEGGTKLASIDPKDYPGKKGGIPDGWTNDAIRAARDAARAAGKVPVLAHQATTIKRMVEVAFDYLEASELGDSFLDTAFIEHAMCWLDGGILCKGRPDAMAKDRRVILEYKSCANAEPDAFLRTALGMGYDIQGAMYQRGNAATGGPERSKFVWLAQEVEEPFACSLVGMSPQMEDIAERKLEYGMALWANCIRTGKWNGYPNRVAWVEYPEWAVRSLEERLEIGAQA